MHAVLLDQLSRSFRGLMSGGASRLLAVSALGMLSGAVVDRCVFRPFFGDVVQAANRSSASGAGDSLGGPRRTPADASSPPQADAEEPLIVSVDRQWQSVARISRPLLLGSRNVAEGSCISLVEREELEKLGPRFSVDLDGGPGTTISILLEAGRASIASAAADYAWHQSRLVTHLANQSALHSAALARANRFFLQTERLVERLEGFKPADAAAWPQDLVAALPEPSGDTWPGLCLARLSASIERRDLAGARRWAHELSGAVWRIVDLHRWTVFLSENHLEALRFQQMCRGCFEVADRLGTPYVVGASPSSLPAGLLTLHGRDNYLEVERQAEKIFAVSKELLAALQTDQPVTGPALLVPPLLRPTFLAYLAALGEANRSTLLRATRTPYETSFLFNSLFRATQAGTADEQCEVLRRFDRITPRASVDRVMGAFVYRGHFFAGFDWSDRYADALHAEPLTDPAVGDADAFRAACMEARDAFASRASYGPTLTLRQSLESGVIDCVRATDMVLTRYRNDGRSGVGHVRWLTGGAGHSVPVLFGAKEGGRPILIDPLLADPQPEVWPDAYVAGATWPEVLAGQPPLQGAELYVRGIDSYVWAQGLCIDGPNAGQFVSASVPYLPGFSDPPKRVEAVAPAP